MDGEEEGRAQAAAGFEPGGQELLVALAGAVGGAVELPAGGGVIGGDLVLVLLGDVEADEDLAVAGGAELADDLADQGGVLPRQKLAQLPLPGGLRREDRLAVGLGLAPRGLPVVLDGEAPGDAG